MSNVPDKIDLVRNLIEHRFMLHMTKNDIVADLLENHKIEEELTEIVWEGLEKENSALFRAYSLNLMVITQINRYNELLEQQAKLMSEQKSVTQSESTSNGSQSTSSAPLAPGLPVNVGQANQESSSGSTTLRTDANAQNSGQQDNESGGNDTDTPSNN